MSSVFIIDDQPVVRTALRRQLEKAQIEVIGEAENHADALRKASGLRLDIIILDGPTPLSKGLAALATLTSTLPNTRIIYLGAHPDSIYANAILQAGAHTYIHKDDADTKIVAAVQALR